MKVLTICFLLLLGSWSSTNAQGLSVNSDTLQWNVDRLTDIAASVTENFQCSFISYGRDQVTWLQKEGTYITVFTVTSIVGNWSDVTKEGSIKYHVLSSGKAGELIFSREPLGVSIRMVFLENNTNMTPFKFNVANINPAP